MFVVSKLCVSFFKGENPQTELSYYRKSLVKFLYVAALELKRTDISFDDINKYVNTININYGVFLVNWSRFYFQRNKVWE